MGNFAPPGSQFLLQKRTKKGFAGYPVATVSFYGPTNTFASKVAVGIIPNEGAEPSALDRWANETIDVRNDPEIIDQILSFISANGAKSVVSPSEIIGCPHEEGIDYLEGQSCPNCHYWAGRDRFSGNIVH